MPFSSLTRPSLSPDLGHFLFAVRILLKCTIASMALPVGFNPKRTFRVTDSTGKETDFFEVCLFAGAAVIGQSGTGSVTVDYNSTWLAEFRADKTVHVFRQDNGALSWTEITDDLPVFPTFTGNERRFSFAFDQNLRLVYAYELNEVIYMTRFSGGDYVQDILFAGTNPTLLAEALPARFVADSDVICFYQKSSDMTKIYNRIQSDNYGVERELVDYGSDSIILDRAFYDSDDPLRYFLLIADEYGEKIFQTDVLQGYASELYPYRMSLDTVRMSVSVSPTFIYNQIVFYYYPEWGATMAVSLAGMAYNPIVFYYYPEFGVTQSLSLAELVYEIVAVVYSGMDFGATQALSLVELAYEVVAIVYEPSLGATMGLGLVGLTYET